MNESICRSEGLNKEFHCIRITMRRNGYLDPFVDRFTATGGELVKLKPTSMKEDSLEFHSGVIDRVKFSDVH